MKAKEIVSILALGILLAATYYQWYWVWGVFFLYWSIRSIQTKTAFLLFNVYQKESPVLYWTLNIFWLLYAFYLLSDLVL
jgi:hypothetical protein